MKRRLRRSNTILTLDCSSEIGILVGGGRPAQNGGSRGILLAGSQACWCGDFPSPPPTPVAVDRGLSRQRPSLLLPSPPYQKTPGFNSFWSGCWFSSPETVLWALQMSWKPPALPKSRKQEGKAFSQPDKQVFPASAQLSEKSVPVGIQRGAPPVSASFQAPRI